MNLALIQMDACFFILKVQLFNKKGVLPVLCIDRKDAQQKNGGYLLSRSRSTIGVTGLNFSVRNGKRWNPCAITT